MMQEKNLWFPIQEYDARIKRAREIMKIRGIDLLFITGDRNYIYFTGHRIIAPEGTTARPNFFILPLEGDPQIMIHNFLERDASSTSWVQNINSYQSLFEAPIKELASLIRGYKIRSGKIGAELGQDQRIGMPVRDFLLLEEEIREFEFIDAAPTLWEIRSIKSPHEIKCIRDAEAITVKGYVEGFPLIREGMTEKEIARILTGKMVEYGAEHFWIIVSCVSKDDWRISRKPSDRKVRNGNMVWVDMGAVVNDYWSDFSRAGVVGGPSREQIACQRAVVEATAEGVSAVKAGVPGCVVADICEQGLRKRGFDISFQAGRVGHSIGLLLTEPPSISKHDPVILAENMVISIEPGIIQQGIYHVEENVLVTNDGCEILSQAPRDLWSLG